MLRRNWINLFSGLALVMCGACSWGAGNGNSQATTPQLAAAAASTPYPTNLRVDNSVNVGALVEPSSKMVRIFNFGQAPLTNLNVWVNSTFVCKLDTLPASAYVNLNMSDFYDHSGNSLASSGSTVSKVQLESSDHLWTLLGPIVQ